MGTETDELREAAAHHRAGRLAAAAAGYRAVLARDPRQPDALYLLGVVAHQTGQNAQAARLFRETVAVKPDHAYCWNLLGLALAAQGDSAGAEECICKAIAITANPDYFLNLGNVLKAGGRTDEAAEAYQAALRIDPGCGGAHYSLGNLRRTAGALEEAAACFERAVDAEPAHGDSLAALGQTLNALGRPAEALPFLERAVRQMPDDAGLACDLGDALATLGRPAEAAVCYARNMARAPVLERVWLAPGEGAEVDNLNAAWARHRAGQLDEAAAEYRAVLARDAHQPDALYLLGVVAQQTGSNEQAAHLFRQALSVRPGNAHCWNLLGLSLSAQGDAAGAEGSFRQAIAIAESADYFVNLGDILKKAGRAIEAAAAYRTALRINPSFAIAHYSLGNLHRLAGELEDAAACFERAVDAEAGHDDSLAALGQTLTALGRPAEALPFLERAVHQMPQDPGLACDLGDALAAMGRRAEAAAAYDRAIAGQPDLARAWFASACMARDGDEFAAAAERFRQAAWLRPQWVEAHHNLGYALFHTGQVDEALDAFAQASAVGIGNDSRSRAAAIVPGSPRATNATILAVRQDWARRALPAVNRASRHRVRDGRLRIGYLSVLFHQRTWMKPVWGVIHAHDRENVQVHLFSDMPERTIGAEYRRHPDDIFHDISGLSNPAAAELITQSGVDVLVDLNGYSAEWRLPLLAARPVAPIVGWFNLYATSGMDAYDCLVGDAVVIPPEEEQFYCERIARVPGTYLAFEVGYATPDVTAPPSLQPGNPLAFGCLASQYKITPDLISAWSEILRQAPASTLLLKNAGLVAEGMRNFVRSRFEHEGVAGERLVLEGPAEHDEFLQAYGRMDVALDTFPYSGGTTTTEALWQGVPVITFSGDRWAARTSESLLLAAGLGEFVATDLESYISMAVSLAQDAETPARLAELRRNLRDRLRASAACDTVGLARHLERIYEQELETLQNS